VTNIMYLLKSMLPYDASTEYTPMPSDAGQHRNQQQFWLSKAQAKDLYFYLLSSPMARHPHDKQIGIAVGCTSQIFSLGSPTITSVFTSTFKRQSPISKHEHSELNLLQVLLHFSRSKSRGRAPGWPA